jgi:SAM-dependent methyltransferase
MDFSSRRIVPYGTAVPKGGGCLKPAHDSARDYVRLVADGYDACANDYNDARSADDAGVLDQLLLHLTPGARVLDLGCGAGVPIARALVGYGCDVVGADLSAGQLALARVQVPGASFVQADMRSCAFAPGSLDAIVSFYAIFHVPRREQEALFGRIASWLRPGGHLLVSVGRTDNDDYTEQFFGVEMFWSHFDAARYRAMVATSGFTLLDDSVLSHGYGDAAHPAESHPLLFAQKRA